MATSVSKEYLLDVNGKVAIDKLPGELITTSELNTALSVLATDAEVATLLGGYATEVAVETAIDLVMEAIPQPTTSASALTSGTLADARLSSNVTKNEEAQTLANKTISGANNTFSNIPESALNKSYLGQVATRCILCLGKYAAATGQFIQYRSMHWIRDNVTQLKVVFPHFYSTSSNVETVVSGGTIKASIEYPLGVYTLSSENIESGGAINCGTGFTVLTFNVTIPKDAQFWVRALEINDAGPVYSLYQNKYLQPLSEGMEAGTGTPTDKTMGGTIAWSDGFIKTPILILGQTIKPSVLIVGDSISIGATEIVTDQSGDAGNTARTIGKVLGYTNFGISASRLSTYNSATRTYRDQIANGTIEGISNGKPYFTHLVISHGINDLQGGDTAAALAARRVTLAALYPSLTVIGTTLTPNASTTDAWTTTANQTPTSTWPKIRDFNNLVRAGIAGEKFYWDVADGVDPYRSGKFPVSRNPNDTAKASVCTFTGSISGNTLTVTAISSGALSLFDTIVDVLTNYPNILPSTIITSFGTGTGGTGTYILNNSQTIASRTMYVGGFASMDGLHLTAAASEMIRDSGVVKMNYVTR